IPSPPHPRLRNRHSLPRAVSNGAHLSDYAARDLWTATPCDSLEYRRVVPTSESPTIRPESGARVPPSFMVEGAAQGHSVAGRRVFSADPKPGVKCWRSKSVIYAASCFGSLRFLFSPHATTTCSS